jgi:hypothetical protein
MVSVELYDISGKLVKQFDKKVYLKMHLMFLD